MREILKAMGAAAVVFAIGAPAQAAMVTWGVDATFGSTSITGTLTFDDTPVQGFFDGIVDLNDTHVLAEFVLSSTALGWTDVQFSNVTLQPYFYSNLGDGPHVDFTFSSNGWNVEFANNNEAGLNGPTGSFVLGQWALDRGQQIPEPTSLALVAIALLAAGARRSDRR